MANPDALENGLLNGSVGGSGICVGEAWLQVTAEWKLNKTTENVCLGYV